NDWIARQAPLLGDAWVDLPEAPVGTPGRINHPRSPTGMQVRVTLLGFLGAIARKGRSQGSMQGLDEALELRHVRVTRRLTHGCRRGGSQESDPQVPDLEAAFAGRLGAGWHLARRGNVVVGLAHLEDPGVQPALADVLSQRGQQRR